MRKKIVSRLADKVGATLILNYHTVVEEIEKELFDEEKYEVLNVKPDAHCTAVADKAKKMIINLNNSDIISDKDKTCITGLNKNNNMKHAPEYRAEHPYIYPLFKIHKLNQQEIKNKTIPPCRMVNAAKNGPLYRMEKWISHYLSSASQIYCQNEFLLDTPHLIEFIKDYNDNASNTDGNINLFTMDVKSLYSSIKPELAIEALTDFLRSDISLNNNLKTIIENFVKFILEESFVSYKNKSYKSKVGIPTGGCNSRQIADIFLQWLLFKIVKPSINECPLVTFWKRYIDDCLGLWVGNKEGFDEFVTQLNEETAKFGISFPIEEIQFGKSVNFLDLNIYLDEENKINYRLFIKPTDARRFLNPSSFHPKHVFNSIPFSQMLRIIKRNSKRETCLEDINTLKLDLIKSGYNKDFLESCEVKAFRKVDEPGIERLTENNTIVFTVDYFENLQGFKILISNIQEDIKPLLGDIKIKLSTRKSSSIGNLLVKNKLLCEEKMVLSDSQKCGDKRCGVCPLMFTTNSTIINNKELKIPKKLNCKSKDCIYLCVCSQCNQNNAYFGKTVQEYHNRMTGHRQSFNINKFMKSALSMHAYDCHNGEIKLKDYKLAVVKAVSPRRLNREEFVFIDKYETQTKGLNRYQVV